MSVVARPIVDLADSGKSVQRSPATPVSRDLVQWVVIQLLLRRQEAWSGAAARSLVWLALTRCGHEVAATQQKNLIASAFRVGREFEPIGLANREFPWPMEEVRLLVDAVTPAAIEGADRAAVVHNLASKLRGFEPDRPIQMDWCGMVTRAVRQEAVDEHLLALEAKLALGSDLERIYLERLQSLAIMISRALELDLEELVEVVTMVMRERRVPAVLAMAPLPDRVSRVDPRELDRVSGLASDQIRADFRAWLGELEPIAQWQAMRRIDALASGSALSRLWVKPILTPARHPIAEMRIVAGHVHYRVLFATSARRTLEILAFGFRRDLEDLVRLAVASLA
jgi:hypothetical protein